MRNLGQYPITKAEVIGVIKSLQEEENNKGTIGSIRPIILSYLEEFCASGEEFDKYLKGKEADSS